MIYRTLGNTGLQVSILGYGASPLGSVFRAIDEAEGIRTVRTAIDGGVNLIDCSPYYGITTAETVLGKALREIPRDHYYLATKAGRYGDAKFDFPAARIGRSLDESQRRLGVDHVDILQLHDIEFGDLEQVIEESLPLLARLKEQGRIGWYGVTGLPLRIFREVLARHPLDTILSYCRYTLNDTSLAALLPDLATAGVGVISASATGMACSTRGACRRGTRPRRRSATRPPRWWHSARSAAPAPPVWRCSSRWRSPGSTPTLVGTASPQNMSANLSCVDDPPDPELLAAAHRLLQPVRDATWPSGRAENN